MATFSYFYLLMCSAFVSYCFSFLFFFQFTPFAARRTHDPIGKNHMILHVGMFSPCSVSITALSQFRLHFGFICYRLGSIVAPTCALGVHLGVQVALRGRIWTSRWPSLAAFVDPSGRPGSHRAPSPSCDLFQTLPGPPQSPRTPPRPAQDAHKIPTWRRNGPLFSGSAASGRRPSTIF